MSETTVVIVDHLRKRYYRAGRSRIRISLEYPRSHEQIIDLLQASDPVTPYDYCAITQFISRTPPKAIEVVHLPSLGVGYGSFEGYASTEIGDINPLPARRWNFSRNYDYNNRIPICGFVPKRIPKSTPIDFFTDLRFGGRI